MKQIAQLNPTKISDLDFKTNAFTARTFAGALVASKNYFQTAFGYNGPVANKFAFQDGDKVVYKFFSASGTINHEAYFVF